MRALEGAAQTVAALEDAVRLMEQRYADREVCSVGAHRARGHDVGGATQRKGARTGRILEAWVGRGDIGPTPAEVAEYQDWRIRIVQHIYDAAGQPAIFRRCMTVYRRI